MLIGRRDAVVAAHYWFRVTGAEFVAFVEYGRQLGLTPMKVQDHTTTISVYFKDPYGHDLEVTTWECEQARIANVAKI